MARVFASPSRYIQGKDVFKHVDEYVKDLGDVPLVICDDDLMKTSGSALIKLLKEKGFAVSAPSFNGTATDDAVAGFVQAGQQHKADFVIGLGGKSVDIAKNVAQRLDVKVAILPTDASTDAPMAALSIVHNDDGSFKNYQLYDSNPDIVLVDTQVIADSPVNTLIAGIGHSLATGVETHDVAQGHHDSPFGGSQTITSMTIAESVQDVILKHSQEAISANRAGIVTPALEAITEINILTVGLGFESGLAAAHAIYDGFAVIPGDSQKMLHGEKVAYATLCELMLDNVNEAELNQFIDFDQKLGLPTTLEDLHMENCTYDDFLKVGEAAAIPTETIHNMPMNVTAEDIANAIMAVNDYVTDRDRK